MKKISFFISISAFLSIATFAQTTTTRATVGFYNVENLFDTQDDPLTDDAEYLPEGKNQWTAERYSIKLTNLSKAISSFSPDILGLGEIENRKVLEDLVTQPSLAGKRYQIVHFDMQDERGVDVALIYRPAVFKPFHIQQLVIKDPKEPEFKTRNILWVKGLFLGDTLHVAINHWPSRIGGKEDKRLLAAAVLRKAVDSVMTANPQSKIIMMGDFNDDPNNKSIKKVLIGQDDKDKPASLVNIAEPTFKKGYGTLAYNGVWNLFDQMIISTPLADGKAVDYTPETFTVFAAKPMQEPANTKNAGMPMRSFRSGVFNPNGYSDHYPVFAVFQVIP